MTRTSIKAPPYSVASEKIVLGSIIADPAVLDEVRPIIANAQVFFRPEHGRLYGLLINLCGASDVAAATAPPPGPEELITILSAAAASTPRADHPSDEAQLRELAAAAVDHAGLLFHARVVAEKHRVRCLIDTLTDLLNNTYQSDAGFDAIIESARARLDALQLRVGDRRDRSIPAATPSASTKKKVRKRAKAK